MRKMFRLLAVSLCVMAMVGMATQAGEKKYRIGLCMASLDTFLGFVADAAVAEGAKKGVEISIMDAQDDTIRQTDQVNTLLNDGVDALIINIVETSAAPPMLAAAKRANKPIVFVNRNPFVNREVPPNVYVVSPDTLREGGAGMEYVGKALGGKGNIVILMGMLGHEAATNRTQGVKDVIKDKYPDIKILDEQTGNWARDQGMVVTENLITAHGDQINAVLSNNDEMALGAILALQARNMKDKVLVVGVDGTPDGLASVAAGGINATAFQDAVAQGAGSVDIAVDVLDGKQVPAVTRLPVTLVTKDNVKDFMKR